MFGSLAGVSPKMGESTVLLMDGAEHGLKSHRIVVAGGLPADGVAACGEISPMKRDKS
jgi:hypothetical protein